MRYYTVTQTGNAHVVIDGHDRNQGVSVHSSRALAEEEAARLNAETDNYAKLLRSYEDLIERTAKLADDYRAALERLEILEAERQAVGVLTDGDVA
jgi:hypothetical protein